MHKLTHSRYTWLLVQAMSLWGVGTSSLARAQGICDSAIQNFCSSSTDRSNRCLETLYTCGEYNRILGLFRADLIEIDIEQKYFLGASSLALADQQRAQSTKCAYNDQAKQSLFDFLSAAQKKYGKTGDYGDQTLMRYVYSGTKLMTIARKLNGCLEDGHSQTSINSYALSYSEQSLKDLFIGGASTDKDMADAYSSLNTSLQSFVDKAAGLETKLAMSRLEIDFANEQLASIKSGMEKDIGKLNLNAIKPEDVFDQSILNSVDDDLNTSVEKIRAKQQKISSAMNCEDTPSQPGTNKKSCIDQYAENKDATLQRSHVLRATAQTLSNFSQSYFQSNEHHFKDFVEIKTPPGRNKSVAEKLSMARGFWADRAALSAPCKKDCSSTVKEIN
ncbi:MAG TPA: hypothetical protein VE954_04000 [Oligoflexus sp.]|uniref:hypothetical protein n=1 Tax=Oligoflexus sp. TaxID=1971216 RepID=UPI002D4EF973|nr:hypothetical protein [Oligoflexus sp.]HYX32250.1 hypothetical protein [Oligoflexus sp.]